MAPFKSKSAILQLLFFTMVFALLKSGEARLPLIPPKTTVQIINNFFPPQDLTLHCQSKDDDLGEHTIKAGQAYSFRFRPLFFRVATLFWCSFQWPSDMSLHYFDIYVQEQDENNCDESSESLCSWKIWKIGACKYDADVHGYTQCYPWNKPKLLTTTTATTPNSIPRPASFTNITSYP